MGINGKGLQSSDVFRLQMVSDPQLSPDGSRVAWVLTWMEAATNQYRSNIYVTDRQFKKPRRLTRGQRDTHPRWSPDGRNLAFLQAVNPQERIDRAEGVLGGGSTLALLDVGSGAITWMDPLLGGVQDPVWCPGGDTIFFTSYIEGGQGLKRLSEEVPSEDPEHRFNRDVLRVGRLQYKADGVGYLGNCYRQVVRVSVSSTDGFGDPIPIHRGHYDLQTPRPSPDGRWLALVGNTEVGGERERRAWVYLWDRSAEGAALQPLVSLEEMRSTDLSWSPTGESLVISGHDDPQLGHYGNQRVWWVSVPDGDKRCLTQDLDMTFGNASRDGDIRDYPGMDHARWLPDGTGLLVLGNEEESTHLYHLSLEGECQQITAGDGAVMAFSMDDAGRHLLVHYGDSLDPGDLYCVDRFSGVPAVMHRLTAVNQAVMGEVDVSPPIAFVFESEGVSVKAWVVPPLDAEPGRRYPLILYNGGGPGGMRTGLFNFGSQVLAARGYAVLHCNARGNHGRGEAFSAAVRGIWGEGDYRDNLKALETAQQKFQFVDPERSGVFGGSYGGYMTNWMIARHPEFKAAVSINCVFNRLSHFGTGDMTALLNRVEFDRRPPWEDVESYWHRSPMKYVEDIEVPTLVIHAGEDHRCPVEQGEQLYFALRYRGVPTEFIRIGHDSHGIRKPWHRVYRLDVMLEWFDRWMAAEPIQADGTIE